MDHNGDGINETYPWPDIIVVGNIDNLSGNVNLSTYSAGDGDIKLTARVRAKNLSIVAGGTFFVDGVTTLAVGGEPYTYLDDATTGSITTTVDPDETPGSGDEYEVTSSYPGIGAASDTEANAIATRVSSEVTIYGDKIFINAEYLDINGIMQSGRADYILTLDGDVRDEILGISPYQTGKVVLNSIDNKDFIVTYDTATDQIVIEELRVSGGYIELEGNILSTGTGEIRILGGYGDIGIDNDTGLPYDLVLNRLDASQRGAGTLLIIDKAKDTYSGNTVVSDETVTIYQSSGSTITKTVDDGYAANGGASVTSLTSDTDTYTPAAGWRYGWSVGVGTFERDITHYRSAAWLGIDDLAADPDNIYDHDTEVADLPALTDEGPYYFRSPDADPATPGYQAPAWDPYTHTSQTTSTPGVQDQLVDHWEESTWYGTTYYHDIYVDESYDYTIHTHTLAANRQFSIKFIGYDEGHIAVESDGDIIVNDAIVNPSGTTEIKSNNGAILQNGDSPYLSGKRIDLQANKGIGAGTPIDVNVTDEPVYQYTTDSVNYGGDSAEVDPENFTPSSIFSIAPGDRVKLAQDYSRGGIAGAVYEHIGDPGDIDLSIENYGGSDWQMVEHYASLEAKTNKGGIQITEMYGNLPVDEISTADGSDVNLVSQGGVTVGLASNGTAYEGLIQGGAITLTAGGNVGSLAQPIILESGTLVRDNVWVEASGSVYLKEKTGDLRLEKIDAGGDVHVQVLAGGIVDANQEETRDERTYEDFKNGVWHDLQLTGADAQDKIDQKVASFKAVKEQEYRTYWIYRSQQSEDHVVGLVNGETYYVVKVDANRIMLATSYANATAAQPVVIDLEASLTSTAKHWLGSLEFNPSTGVDGAGEAIFLANHSLATGDAIAYSMIIPYDASQTVKLSDAEVDAYTAFYESQGMTAEEIESAIETLETNRTLQYHTLHTQFFAYFDRLGESFPTAYDTGFTYILAAEDEAAIRGSVKVWTESELLNMIGAGLLKAVSDTTTNVEDPNIVGASVTLVASGNVGSAAGQEDIDLTSDPFSLTDDQRVALAAAERDDVAYLGAPIAATVVFNASESTITRTDGSWDAAGLIPGMWIHIAGSVANSTEVGEYYVIESVAGNVLTLTADAQLANESRSITLTPEIDDPNNSDLPIAKIVINRREDVDVDASGEINITAGGNVYLGSELDLNIDTVVAGTTVRIKAAAGFTMWRLSGPPTLLAAI